MISSKIEANESDSSSRQRDNQTKQFEHSQQTLQSKTIETALRRKSSFEMLEDLGQKIDEHHNRRNKNIKVHIEFDNNSSTCSLQLHPQASQLSQNSVNLHLPGVQKVARSSFYEQPFSHVREQIFLKVQPYSKNNQNKRNSLQSRVSNNNKDIMAHILSEENAS